MIDEADSAREGSPVKISIKDFDISMNFGNNGITLDVYDNEGKHQGDLRIGKAIIEWCRGKTQKGNGVKKKWTDLIAFFEA